MHTIKKRPEIEITFFENNTLLQSSQKLSIALYQVSCDAYLFF